VQPHFHSLALTTSMTTPYPTRTQDNLSPYTAMV